MKYCKIFNNCIEISCKCLADREIGLFRRPKGSGDMFRVAGICFVLVIVCASAGFSQGLFESVLGPNGFGIYSGPNIQSQMMGQFSNPQFLGIRNPQERGGLANSALPGQSQPPWPGAQQTYGQQPAYGQGIGQQQYAQQGQGTAYTPGGGLYPDWYQNVTPQAPAQPQYVQPQPQPQYTQPAPAPRQPVQARAAPRRPAQTQPQAPIAQPPLRPGQYTRNQPPPAPRNSVEDLPAGAVRVTVDTPEGKSVQMYPPPGTPMPMAATVQPRGPQAPQGKPRRLRAKSRTTAKRPTPSTSKAVPLSNQVSTSKAPEKQHIAMPTPISVPQGKDPRIGWGHAVKRLPKKKTEQQ